MPLAGQFTFRDTPAAVLLTIATKGVPSADIDVLVTSAHVRVSYKPYLLAIDLHADVDDDATEVTLDKAQHTLQIKLKKVVKEPWPSVARAGTLEDNAPRREASIDAHRRKQAEVRVKGREIAGGEGLAPCHASSMRRGAPAGPWVVTDCVAHRPRHRQSPHTPPSVAAESCTRQGTATASPGRRCAATNGRGGRAAAARGGQAGG
jgi:hypothetical protein